MKFVFSRSSGKKLTEIPGLPWEDEHAVDCWDVRQDDEGIQRGLDDGFSPSYRAFIEVQTLERLYSLINSSINHSIIWHRSKIGEIPILEIYDTHRE